MSSARRTDRVLAGVALLAAMALLAAYPPFRVRKLAAGARQTAAPAVDVPAFAARFWQEQLRTAGPRAIDVDVLLDALAADSAAAAQRYGHQAGLGGSRYYLVRGSGRVRAVDGRHVWLATRAHPQAQLYLVAGPVFGNALRDVTGGADINRFSSFDFNALSAALNARAETDNGPALRKAAAGQSLRWLAAAEPDPNAAGTLKLVAVEVSVP